ncbi:MAG TPA: ATP-binding protein [Thermoanaerobaculia bacterium]|nr:ATP-binding protein [Thermoanaerobaculia bacterium]
MTDALDAERYRAFVANSSEAIWRFELEQPVPIDVDPDEQIELFYRYGYLAECNEAMARMYGFASPDEIVGARLGDMVVRDKPENIDYLRAFIASGYRLLDAESHEIDRDGNDKWFMNNFIAVIENGHVIRAWGTQRDVTQQHQLVEELQRASRAKDEFLAILSHELRTPMTATLGWAAMLQMGALRDDAMQAAVEAIAQSTRAQARLIDDLLDVARIVAGKLQLSLQRLSLADAIRAAAETIRPAAQAKQIYLQLDLGDDDVRLSGDAARLQQVFWNLLSNAIKYSPRFGRVQVTLERSNDSACVVVRDFGDGIDPQLLPFIFDRYRQGDSGMTRRFGGLGLGLSIARNLTEMHGGTLRAASEGIGKGAEFTVTLPLSAEVRDAPAEQSRAAAPPLAGLRVLVVDDDESTLRMLQVSLAQFGAEVRAAANASEAFDELSRGAFDVLVSDIGMPHEDGCSLMQRVRAAQNPVAAIALSAYAGDAERARALSAGFQAWMTKPFDPAALAEEVRRVAR